MRKIIVCLCILCVAAEDVEYKSITGIKTTYKVLKEGHGSRRIVAEGDSVTVHATGTVRQTGKQFWSTKNPGQQPFRYTAGGGVITGWDMGARGMRKNEVRLLKIPAEEGYGASGFRHWGIPPNADLDFELEVLEIEKPPKEDQDDAEDEDDQSLSAEQLKVLHEQIDKNGDGKVNVLEVMNYASAVIAANAEQEASKILEGMDTAHEGTLLLAEHLDAIHKQAESEDAHDDEIDNRKNLEQAKFMAADANGDQSLDVKEFAALVFPDTQDGVLVAAVAETLRQRDLNHDKQLTPHEYYELDQESEDVPEHEQEQFEVLDTDGDGVLNVHELKQVESGRVHTELAMKQMFEITDKDGDDHITVEELLDAGEQIAESNAHHVLRDWSAKHNEL